jgi:hypothetical protein
MSAGCDLIYLVLPKEAVAILLMISIASPNNDLSTSVYFVSRTLMSTLVHAT